MKTNVNTPMMRFSPFHDNRYNSSSRNNRGFGIKLSPKQDSVDGYTWLIPEHLYEPFNVNIIKNFDGSRVYVFNNAEGIIRVERGYRNENQWCGAIRATGRKQPIHRVIKDKGSNGQLLYSLVQDTLNDDDYSKIRYIELYNYWGSELPRLNRQAINEIIEQYGILKTLFSLEDNDLVLNTALHCGIDNAVIHLGGCRIADNCPVYISDNTVLTFKFKDGSLVTTTLNRLGAGHTHNGFELLGLVTTNEEWTQLFSSATAMREVDKNHPLYEQLDWFAQITIDRNGVAIHVHHKYDDREDILAMFNPILRHDAKVVIGKDIGTERDQILNAINELISAQLEVGKVNVIYINDKIQGIELGWDGNFDEPYQSVCSYSGVIADLDPELYEIICGGPKSKLVAKAESSIFEPF